MQTHHKLYKQGLEVWEYPLSDCITLCKYCHAQEHGIIEPTTGWILISIDDLGEPSGICEKKGCGTEIRYEHSVYHANYGYKVVGSSCVELLTREDQFLSKKVLKVYKNISDFVRKSIWKSDYTKNGNEYLFTMHLHHEIRIYGAKDFYSYQIVLKEKGERWRDFGDYLKAKDKTLEQVKELSYIVLKGKITENKEEKNILRNLYKSAK